MSTAVSESVFSHQRSWASLAAALVRPQVYTGLIRSVTHCLHPLDFQLRYLRGSGKYPTKVALRTPIGPISANAFVPEDILTINEIFFWKDYGAASDDRVIVDFGSNVGISALYFLTRNPNCQIYCFEPLPRNVMRLRINLRPFAGRHTITSAAVADHDGFVDFSWERTGRYGGIGVPSAHRMAVPCVDSNRVLAEIVEKHGQIDLLKIDIERLELELTSRIPRDIALRIRRLAIEFRFKQNPLPDTHDMSYRWPITTLTRREGLTPPPRRINGS